MVVAEEQESCEIMTRCSEASVLASFVNISLTKKIYQIKTDTVIRGLGPAS